MVKLISMVLLLSSTSMQTTTLADLSWISGAWQTEQGAKTHTRG